MNCPRCNSRNIKCVDSRPNDFTVKRRKKCFDCDYRWNTLEITVDRHRELLTKEGWLEDVLNYARYVKQTLEGRKEKNEIESNT